MHSRVGLKTYNALDIQHRDMGVRAIVSVRWSSSGGAAITRVINAGAVADGVLSGIGRNGRLSVMVALYKGEVFPELACANGEEV